MKKEWKRPKVLPGNTERIVTREGTLFFTKCYQDDKLIEVRGAIGKNATLAMVLVDTICKLISIILQSKMPRYKVCKKLKKQFADMNLDMDPFTHNDKKYSWSVDYIIKQVIEELDK